MAGLALVLDLLDVDTNAASVAAVAAAVAGWTSVSPMQFLRSQVAHCDSAAAGTADADDFYNSARWVPRGIHTSYTGKSYVLNVKPLFSAFQPKALAATSIRALLINFLPLIEKSVQQSDSDDEEGGHVTDSADVSIALKRSGYYALREVAVITVRRILERIAVYYVSARIAWKLLKDAPKSAARKAARNLTRLELFACVSKTAFRAHALGIGANWCVQEIIEIYRSANVIYVYRQNPNRPKGPEKELEVLVNLARKTTANTLKGAVSLSFAALGAGCGAVFISPSFGTWLGLAAGDFAGAFLIGIYLEAWLQRP